MKKTATAMLTLVAGIVAASCQKEAEPDIKSFEPMTINAVSEGIGTATKTEMAYKYDILWSENDQIYVKSSTKNATFTLKSGEGTTNGTFECESSPFEIGEKVEAYYPETLIDDGNLVWPAAQTNNQTVPMYSTKTVCGNVEDFNFSSLGSVLQIVFTTPQSDVKLQSIEIQDDTETMSGSFTIDEDGKAIITATDKAGITLNLGDGVSVSNKIAYFSIAVPAGNYQNLTLTFTAKDGAKCVMNNGKVNIEHNIVGRLTLTGKEFKAPAPKGALLGKFTVSAIGKKVYFSKGNLWADASGVDASNPVLHFEANQYAFNSSYESSHVSHFTWSSSVADAVSNSNNGDHLFCDEDNKVSVDGSDAIYYALSDEEWWCLFNNHSYKWATVNGVDGYVIAPDNFVGTLAASYADDAALAADNLLFLPAAGYRRSSDVYDVGTGDYWSSRMSFIKYAHRVYFDSSNVDPDDDGGICRNGYCVRLVTDVK